MNRVWVAVSLCCLQCGGTRAPSDQQGVLAQGVVAKVGSELIAGSAVAAIASAQGVGVKVARDRAVYDLLIAMGATDVGLDRDPAVVVQVRGAMANALLESIRDSSREKPISDEELTRFSKMYWVEVDRPEARRCVHAVVQQSDDKGWALAKRIKDKVKDASEAETFLRLARQVPTDGLKVTAESLPPITRDGRGADPDAPPGSHTTTYDGDFVRALFSLSRKGEQSEPTETRFGVHVILLTQISPEVHLDPEQRRSVLGERIRSDRAEKLLTELIDRRMDEVKPSVSRSATELMTTVRVGSER